MFELFMLLALLGISLSQLIPVRSGDGERADRTQENKSGTTSRRKRIYGKRDRRRPHIRHSALDSGRTLRMGSVD